MIENWKDDLLKEKSFQEVFRASRALPKSTFNRFIYVVAAIIGFAAAAHWIYEGDVQQSAVAATAALDIGFNLTAPILGFLIAGFAIITTVANPRIMVRLAKVEQPDAGVSSFKVTLFNFLSVFYIYIATLAVSIGAKLLSQANFVQVESMFSVRTADLILASTNAMAFFIIGLLIVFSVVRLKSFIWNIYQAFIIFLVVDDLMQREFDPRTPTPTPK